MNGNEELSTLSQNLYDGYGVSDKVGISYFDDYALKIAKYDFELFLDYQMRHFHHQYVLDLILSTSFLWEKISPEVWIKILMRQNARPDTSRTNDQVAMFVDIEFLSRYLQVDALEFFLRSSASSQDKLHALIYFKKYSYSLLPSELDEDDLDGEYFVTQDRLIILKELLCKEYDFNPISYTEENINEYVNQLAESNPQK